MQKYKEFQPTAFDSRGLNADGLGIGDWWVAPVSQTRDSEALSRSNFACCLKELGGESETVQVHRFGHWGPGWYEIILIDPADEAKVTAAEDMESALADYPVLDDEHFSQLEWNEAADCWQHMSTAERVQCLQRADQCIFAARRDEIPQDDSGRLFDLLTRN